MSTYFITGTSRGIGAALTQQLTAAGHKVIGTSTKGGAGRYALDVCDEGAWATIRQELEQTAIDVVIANAGVYLDKGHQLGTGFEQDLWRATFDVNVTGAFMTATAFLPQLRAAQGKIAFISSQMASHVRAPGGSYIYRASKAAVLNIRRNMATDLRADGVAVGIYDPGWATTDMGGAEAEISPEKSARGLIEQIDALSIDTTGCFKRWNGDDHPY